MVFSTSDHPQSVIGMGVFVWWGLTVHACKITQAYLHHRNEQQATESFQFYWCCRQ